MSPTEIQLLQHELLSFGVRMDVPPCVHHMDWDKALSVCFDMYCGFTFREAIDAYDKDAI